MKLFVRIFIIFIFFLFVFLFPSNANAAELQPGSVWQWSTASASLKKEGLTDIIAVSAGRSHNLALKKDGTVWAWGSNSNGQLGIGTYGEYFEDPVQVKDYDGQGYLTGVKEITTSSNGNFSMALKQDRTVWVWGSNNYGARGTGLGLTLSLNYLILPTQVKGENGTGFLSDVISISAGSEHSLALKSDGQVFAWGRQDQGQVGTGGPTNYAIILIIYPKRVIGGVTSIAAGYIHSIVSKTDGSVWGWGRFDSGQLGSIPTDSGYGPKRYTPIKVPEIDNVKSISAGYNTSLGLSSDGRVFEWGSNRYLPDDANPRRIPDLENVKSVAGGFFIPDGYIGAAVKENGDLWVWNMKDLIANQVQDLAKVSMVSVGYNFTWTPNLAVVEMSDLTPTPTLTPTPIPSKTPLILIPGIAGSELKVGAEDEYWLDKDDGHGGKFNHIYPKNEVVWFNEPEARALGQDDYFDVLRMKSDGITSEANIGITGNLLARAYQATIDFFTSNGYQLNKDLFVFPYDWRKDIAGTKDLLDQRINQIKTQTGSPKVDIVAHSMGGLVARNYISDAGKALNVRKLFTLGTPHLGSVKFLKALMYGECLTLDIFKNLPVCLGVNNSETKDLVQNMIAAYQLGPSQTYFSLYNGQDKDHPYPYRTELGALNYSQIKNLLTGLNFNTSLFNPSEAFHNLDNLLSNTNDVDVTVIAGSGQRTLGQIIEEKRTSLSGKQSVHKDILNINGDDTVPLFSASLDDPLRNISLLGLAQEYYTNQKHGDLVSPGPALDLVKDILEGNNQLPNEPYPLRNLLGFSVHSPVNIHVYDSENNHTGPTSDGFETNIPGSSYDTLDDAKFIFVPDNENYTIKFEATDQGSFDFKIRKYDQDTVSEQTLYKDIPLTISTKAETQFDTSSSTSPIIHLDKDGNGTADQDINPTSSLTGDAVFDQTPPQTTIELSGIKGLNEWYKSDVLVTLISQDEENGSGILKTEYSLNNGQTIKTYSQPFTVSQEGINKLKFKSFDNAGNEEDPRETEIKIDKTAPEVKIFVDQDKQDLAVTGVDVNLTTVIMSDNTATKKKDDAFYLIKDLAGNTLKLDVREIDRNKQDRFRIYSAQYNEDAPILLDNNHFNVTYSGKKERANVKEQNFELKGEVKIRIQYDVKKNKSTIIVKEPKREKVKEVKNGLVYLNLLTNKGQLKTSY